MISPYEEPIDYSLSLHPNDLNFRPKKAFILSVNQMIIEFNILSIICTHS